MAQQPALPQQDPAEGSREIIDRELRRAQSQQTQKQSTSSSRRKDDTRQTGPEQGSRH